VVNNYISWTYCPIQPTTCLLEFRRTQNSDEPSATHTSTWNTRTRKDFVLLNNCWQCFLSVLISLNTSYCTTESPTITACRSSDRAIPRSHTHAAHTPYDSPHTQQNVRELLQTRSSLTWGAYSTRHNGNSTGLNTNNSPPKPDAGS
jgi:hypothetical protein